MFQGIPAPLGEGFFMPAEWYLHDKCWIHWPHRPDNWRLNALPARAAYTNVIKAISKFEHVMVAVSSCCIESATTQLKSIENVTIVPMESDDSWMRDTGPTFVIAKPSMNTDVSIKGIDWKFNCWGNMGLQIDPSSNEMVNFMTYHNDQLVASNVCNFEKISYYSTRNVEGKENNSVEFILEGGSIHVDGEGTCITTEECLLHTNRNSHLTKSEIESYLKQYLNVQVVVWIKHGLTGDEDTNGHVDNLACYYAPGKVLLSWTDDESDEFYHVCREAYHTLVSTKDAQNRTITVTKLPVPPVMYYTTADVEGLDQRGKVIALHDTEIGVLHIILQLLCMKFNMNVYFILQVVSLAEQLERD